MAKTEFVIGGFYNWKHSPERLIYLGEFYWTGNSFWHQFALVSEPEKVWCEVRSSDLHMFEESPETLETK